MHNDHDHGDHGHGSEMSPMAARVRALETVLTEKGYVDPNALDLIVESYETKIGPRNAAQVVGACGWPCHGGVRETCTRALVKQVNNKALSYDPKAAALVFDQIWRCEGLAAPVQQVKMSGDEFEVIARRLLDEI